MVRPGVLDGLEGLLRMVRGTEYGGLKTDVPT